MSPQFANAPAAPVYGPEMKEAARHVLWYYGDDTLAYAPGSFTQNLLKAIASADPANRRNLALGFPRYVTLMVQAMDTPGGLDQIRAGVEES